MTLSPYLQIKLIQSRTQIVIFFRGYPIITFAFFCDFGSTPPHPLLLTYGAGVQFNRHLKFKAWVKAWVKDEVKDAFRKALDREMVKAWVKAVQNVY